MANKSTDKNSQTEHKTTAITSTTQPFLVTKKSALSLGRFGVLLLALVAIGLSGYNLFLTKKIQEKNQLNWEQKFNEIQQAFGQFENKWLQRESEISRIAQQVSALSQVKDSSTWQLQEVNYLLQLADLNLKYQRDPAAALNLLTIADERIAKLNHPELNQFRQMLARDMARIRVIQSMDVTGLLAKLQTMTEQLKTLPIIVNTQPAQSTSTPLAFDQPAGIWWQKALQQTRQVLQRLVIIRHYDESTKPLITKDQQYLLTALIQTHLSQAQWAALHYDQTLLQKNLQQVQELTQVTFGTSPQKTAFLTELNELQQVNLAIPMPELTNTIASIPQLKQADTKQVPPASKEQLHKLEKPILQESALV